VEWKRGDIGRVAKDEFVCKPLQRTTIHGFSTDWSYDECIAGISVADTSTVTAVRKHHEDHFNYTFVSGGVISFYDDAYDSSVLQKTSAATDEWKRDGYACYPEPPYDNTYNLLYNFSECTDITLPSSDTILVDIIHQRQVAKYYPFGFEMEIMYPTTPNPYNFKERLPNKRRMFVQWKLWIALSCCI